MCNRNLTLVLSRNYKSYLTVGNNKKMLKMNKLFISLLILISVVSCRSYESEEYIKNENEAINDLISEMTNLKEMSKLNKWKKKPNLYIFSELDNKANWIKEPKGYIISSNGVDLPKETIKKNKKEYLKKLKNHRRTKKLFAPLYKGKMKRRKLDYIFKNDSLNIKLSNVRMEQIKDDDFEYLSISRISFDNKFTTGYLYFQFYCGICCSWNNPIEIKKINNKWTITER